MRIDYLKKCLDANLNEIAVLVKYDSMAVNQGTFYKDSDGEFEMSLHLANQLFSENVFIH